MILDTFDQSGTQTYMEDINPVSYLGGGGGVVSGGGGFAAIKTVIRTVIRSVIQFVIGGDE